MSDPGLFRSVSLFTLEPEEPLPFRVAVYYRGRYITYRLTGQAFEVSAYNRFIYKRISKIYIPEEDFSAYKAYVRSKEEEEERTLYDSAISQEERNANLILFNLRSVTRDLFVSRDPSDLENHSSQIIGMAANIVEEISSRPYIRAFQSLFSKPGNLVTHSTRMSILATYLGYQLGFVNRIALEYLASAAILHDIGKTQLSLSEDPNIAEEQDAELMMRHPELACQMMSKMSFVPDD